jgi:hypothetical protein
MKMPDDSMVDKIQKDQKLELVENWYRCHPVAKGDFVLLKYSQTLDPVVRIVAAVEGDSFGVKQTQGKNAWNLEVNGSFFAGNSGKPLTFGDETPPMLSLYVKSHPNGLMENELIVFSLHSPGDADSGKLGVVNLTDVVGKVNP